MFVRATVGDGVAVVAVDPDPNTTSPAANRIFKLPTLNPGAGFPAAWLAAVSGSPTVELWCFIIFLEDDPDTGRWFRWDNTSFAVPVDQMTPFPTTSIPVDIPSFLRVTAAGGATRVVLGLTA